MVLKLQPLCSQHSRPEVCGPETLLSGLAVAGMDTGIRGMATVVGTMAVITTTTAIMLTAVTITPVTATPDMEAGEIGIFNGHIVQSRTNPCQARHGFFFVAFLYKMTASLILPICNF